MKALITFFISIFFLSSCVQSQNSKIPLPENQKPSPNEAVATFAEGCFWHAEIVFQSLVGVRDAVSGYAGGSVKNPDYEMVGTGRTGHAESVQVYYDPSKISYETLVAAFFASMDPTELNRQGNDEGTQYRSIAFYRNEKEKQVIESAIKQEQKHYKEKIVTQEDKYSGFTGYGDFREMLQRKDIDAIVVATPDHWHAVSSIMAANAGKHVYCEKPLAHSIEEGRAMVTAMQKNKVILQTGSMQRSWDKFRTAVDLVRNGYIGRIKEVLVSVGDPAIPFDLPGMPVPDYLNWDGWVGPAIVRPYHSELSPPIEQDIFPHWRNYKEYGGGILSDWGAHMFDIAQWGLDMDRTGPVRLIPPVDPEAKRGLILEYANGIVMKHENFGRGWGVRFIGEKGSLDISRDYLDSNPANIAIANIEANAPRVYNSTNHYKDWLDCIKSGKQPICDVETGHRSSSVCCLANIAYWMKRPLEWDPKKEQFKNDANANAYVKANIREPWKLS